MTPLAAALRGFAVAFLAAGDVAACRRHMAPDYRLDIAGTTLAGRDDQYLPAVQRQFSQFPGLGITVHDVLLGDDGAALHFTEHGASTRHAGAVAAWRGVAVFRWDGRRLTRGWAEEDYAGRARQLAGDGPDPVPPPHPAPWDEASQLPGPGVGDVVTAWLRDDGPATDPAVRRPAGGPVSAPADEPSTEVDVLVVAGERAAFHATRRSRRGDLWHLAGLVAATDGRVGGGDVVAHHVPAG